MMHSLARGSLMAAATIKPSCAAAAVVLARRRAWDIPQCAASRSRRNATATISHAGRVASCAPEVPAGCSHHPLLTKPAVDDVEAVSAAGPVADHRCRALQRLLKKFAEVRASCAHIAFNLPKTSEDKRFSIYVSGLKALDSHLECAVVGCHDAATDGAHIMYCDMVAGTRMACITPLCAKHNRQDNWIDTSTLEALLYKTFMSPMLLKPGARLLVITPHDTHKSWRHVLAGALAVLDFGGSAMANVLCAMASRRQEPGKTRSKLSSDCFSGLLDPAALSMTTVRFTTLMQQTSSPAPLAGGVSKPTRVGQQVAVGETASDLLQLAHAHCKRLM